MQAIHLAAVKLESENNETQRSRLLLVAPLELRGQR